MNGHPWTPVDIEKLRRLYPKAHWDVIDAKLAPHSHRSIVRTASTLGLHRRKTNKKSKIQAVRKLWKRREELGLTRAELAAKLGYHVIMLGKWERGEATPHPLRIVDWCEALGCELDVVVKDGTARGGVTDLYRSIVPQLAARIVERKLTMWDCDELAHLPIGYTAKLLHPDTKSGKQASWQAVQRLCAVLWPRGAKLQLVPSDGDELKLIPTAAAPAQPAAGRPASG